MFWVPIKDGKTKLWENEATHLRINKKVWIRVKNVFFVQLRDLGIQGVSANIPYISIPYIPWVGTYNVST